jgi:hypothetical protein
MLLLGMDIAHQRIQRWIDRKRTNSWLDLSNLDLDTLPELPPNVRRLNLACNNLTSLAGLPRDLRKLYLCGNTELTMISHNFPPSLIHLDLRGCWSIESIDELPNTIKYLDITSCSSIYEIHKFPNELRICYANYMHGLQQIHSWPSSLQVFTFSETRVTVLPEFPTSLLLFESIMNPLTTIPKLPSKLRVLDILGAELGHTNELDFPTSLVYLSLESSYYPNLWSLSSDKLNTLHLVHYSCDIPIHYIESYVTKAKMAYLCLTLS